MQIQLGEALRACGGHLIRRRVVWDGQPFVSAHAKKLVETARSLADKLRTKTTLEVPGYQEAAQRPVLRLGRPTRMDGHSVRPRDRSREGVNEW